MKAMILAAGLGSRLKPLTDHIPKAMVNIHGRPMISFIIDKLQKSGITEIIINIHHFADQIVNYIEKQHYRNIQIQFSDERSTLLDTGGAIYNASWFLNGNESFLVHNVDIFTDLKINDLIQEHLKNHALCTLAVSGRKTSRYLLFDKSNRLIGWKNIKTGETIMPGSLNTKMTSLAFSGIQVIDPKIFKYLQSFAEKNTCFSIIDVYLELLNTNLIKGFDHSGGKWIDMGKMESYPLPDDFLD